MASYGWTQPINEEVPDGGTIEVAAPGCGNADCDVANAEVAAGGVKMETGQFAITFGADVATVTNSSGAAWPAGGAVYVYAPELGVTGDNAAALAAQVNANTSAIAALDTRVTALEGGGVTRKAADDDDDERPHRKGRK